ncbi:hypothetical protein [Mycobacterium sp. E2238]|uniref:hypothetical protein n=1 Tax=Mycobacterium sp. E2238 TaxID=1834131 RepID=UPI0012E9E516|nr:hypothetical protein [Mycobacterium sp. E2238]
MPAAFVVGQVALLVTAVAAGNASLAFDPQLALIVEGVGAPSGGGVGAHRVGSGEEPVDEGSELGAGFLVAEARLGLDPASKRHRRPVDHRPVRMCL